MAVGLADPDAGGVVSEYLTKAERLQTAVVLVAVVLIGALCVASYRVGYADGARQAAPLAAPPTTTERAR